MLPPLRLIAEAADFAAQRHTAWREREARPVDVAAYVKWAEKVVTGCRGVNPGLDAKFDEAVKAAKSVL